ncbi:hypothetical protein P9112_007483 [Eukaryota sp. TZLM1-RC]
MPVSPHGLCPGLYELKPTNHRHLCFRKSCRSTLGMPLPLFGLISGQIPEYSVATNGVSLRLPFSHIVKPTRRRRTTIEMKKARGQVKWRTSTPLISSDPRPCSKKSPWWPRRPPERRPSRNQWEIAVS